MADYNERLSRLHQKVVQDVLRVPASISDMGHIEFTDPDLGEVEIDLREYNPEYMGIESTVFGDYGNPRDRPGLVGLCNDLNWDVRCGAKVPRFNVYNTKNSVVNLSVALLVAAPRQMPDEAFLRAVFALAMSSMKAAAKQFAVELQALDSGSYVPFQER